MLKKISILIFFLLVFFPLFLPQSVSAQSKNLICTIFPFLENIGFGIGGICSGQASGQAAFGFIRFLLSAVFVVIIIISIYIIIKSALKYIQSEGDEKKIGEASKAIKAVFIGIAALFIGIIGIIIVLAFFNASDALKTEGDVPSVIDQFLNSNTTSTTTPTRGFCLEKTNQECPILFSEVTDTSCSSKVRCLPP